MDITKAFVWALVSLLLCSSACSNGGPTTSSGPADGAPTSLSVGESPTSLSVGESPTSLSVGESQASTTLQSAAEVELVVEGGTEDQIAELVTRISELDNEIAELRILTSLQTEIAALRETSAILEDSVATLTNDVSTLQEVDTSPSAATVLPVVQSLVDQNPELLRGPKGDAGEQGETGAQGETGPQGDTGPQGLQGQTGAQGETGLQGDTGLQGLQGQTGAQGDAGPQGQTGLQGLQGQTGSQGPRGFTGPTNSDGVTSLELSSCISSVMNEIMWELDSATTGGATASGWTDSWYYSGWGDPSTAAAIMAAIEGHGHSFEESSYSGHSHTIAPYIYLNNPCSIWGW